MGFSSEIRPREIVIDDSNWQQFARDIVLDGSLKTRGWFARPEGEHGYGSAFNGSLIPRSEWDARIQELEQRKARLSDLFLAGNVPCKDQSGTYYCWIFAAVSAFEGARLVQGQPYVPLSPASAGGPITGYRNVGGWSTRGLQYIAEHGLVPTSLWPDTAISQSHNTAEANEQRKRFRCQEWWELGERNFDQLATCLLSGIPVAIGLNWWGHAIVACDLVKVGGGYGVRIRNSWGARWGEDGFGILSGGKEIPDDAIAPRVAIAS